MLNDMPPLISIGMSVRNCASSLPLTLRSILRQTVSDWELILIDDGSTDDTLSVARCFSDPRIRLVTESCSRGLAHRLNQAVDLARGSFFARMDGDDVCFPERLAQQLALLESDPRLDLVAVRCLAIDDRDEPVAALPLALDHEALCKAPWRGFYLPHPTWMGRTEWFRRNRYAVPAPYCSEDQELLLRTYCSSVFATVPEILFAYRLRSKTPWLKLWKTRKTIFEFQLRHFIAKRQWRYAALSATAFVMRAGSDALDVIFPASAGLYRQCAHILDSTDVQRWGALRASLEANPTEHHS